MSLSLEGFAYKKKPSVFSIESSDSEGEQQEKVPESQILAPSNRSKKRKAVIIASDSEDSEPEVIEALSSPPATSKQPPKRKRICIDDDDDDDIDDDDFQNDDVGSENGQLNGNDSIEDDIDEIITEKNTFREFLNTCQIDELLRVDNVSQTRAAQIVSLRPFSTNKEMSDKINEKVKGFKFQTLYDSYIEYVRDLDAFEKLLRKCVSISNQVRQETLMLTQDSDHLPIQQPSCVPPELKLKHYQMIGLNWLAMLHEKDLSAILADQMGLGKTIQTLAFIGYLFENGQPGRILIVCPVSTLDNWLREFEKWLPDVSYITYTGNPDERRYIRQDIWNNESDIIITSYNMVVSSPKDRAFFRKLEFQYMIMDEAHMMKNMRTERYRNFDRINAKQKLLLTGTPLQNDIIELMSLLNFLMPTLFSQHHETVKRIFFNRSDAKSESSSAFRKKYINKVKQIVKPFMMRRLKSEVLGDLPEKREETCLCPLNTAQSQLYRSYVSSFAAEQNENSESRSDAAGLGVLMNLRKVTNHPLLVRSLYTYEKLKEMARLYVTSPLHFDCDYNYVLEDMTVLSDSELHQLCNKEAGLRHLKLSNEVLTSSGKLKMLDTLLPKLKEQGHRVLIFSQFVIVLDLIQEYLKIRQHSFVRFDGSTKGCDRQGIIDEFNNNRDIFIFLLSTRSGGLGINLTSADTVILHDIDFNPYNDKQAEDRCHRVGQTKDVTIYRLIGKDTIEENMLKIGEKKLELEKKLVGNRSDKGVTGTTIDTCADEEEAEEDDKATKIHLLTELRNAIKESNVAAVGS
ncbi:SWI/SNF-related matrix-associated actin-dependent regulator of chromatin subfamily A containing DEAD/H box 1-like isoform X1 [Clytia hemisphaerica]|uniref:SWI/SNF-related matrix-associated actin-dependent regulator of chromatin subfamily A containing DEAD/H box 1-like isoform X1 n=1 Tax=Clytia hemisphaerica TaxID=252671 RepID=UPI0034D65753